MTKTVRYNCDFCKVDLSVRNQIHLATHIGENANYAKYDACDTCMTKYLVFTEKLIE